MATTITDFFQRAATKQFARDFLFRIKQVTIAGQTFVGNDDLVYARSGSLPGRNIENKQAKYFGQNFNVPGAATYPNSESYQIEFYHDEAIELRKKFELASRTVFNDATSTGEYQMPGRESVIVLSVLNRQLAETSTITLIGASIRNINPVDYSIADGNGEILKLTVTLSYHLYDQF
jgi:hypothetical protein